VRSVRGVNGGFTLARHPGEITMRDVAGLFMDLSAYHRCLLGRPECDGSCGAHDQWHPLATRIETMLATTTIDQLG